MERKFIYGIAGLLCILAVFPLPYGFYTFLRLSVTVAGVMAALELKKENNFLWILLGAIALFFNPFIPVHLDKGLWFPIDLFVAGTFGWMVYRNA